MNQKLMVTIGLVLLAGGIGVATYLFSAPSAATMRHDREITINDQLIKLEIANTPSAIVQGLSGRKTMAKDEGMLFVMPNVENQSFWMKDMKFALDIVFLREGRVVDVVTLDPPGPFTIPRHTSKTEADMVLELTAGRAQELQLTEGTRTTINELR